MTQFMRKSFPVPFMGRAYGEGWERTFGKDKQDQEVPVREYNGSQLSIKMTYHGYSEHRFRVELMGGEWPSDNDLITICDGDTPPDYRHFGGRVSKSTDGRSADVTVYVD